MANNFCGFHFYLWLTIAEIKPTNIYYHKEMCIDLVGILSSLISVVVVL